MVGHVLTQRRVDQPGHVSRLSIEYGRQILGLAAIYREFSVIFCPQFKARTPTPREPGVIELGIGEPGSDLESLDFLVYGTRGSDSGERAAIMYSL